MAIGNLQGVGAFVYFMLLLDYLIWSEEYLLSCLCIMGSF